MQHSVPTLNSWQSRNAKKKELIQMEIVVVLCTLLMFAMYVNWIMEFFSTDFFCVLFELRLILFEHNQCLFIFHI